METTTNAGNCDFGDILMDVTTRSAEETVELGRKIGANLQANDVVCLTGTLGAGKTTLIQGIAEGVGVKDYVTSPTFILINEYQGRIPFFHVDLYRLNSVDEVEDLGIEEYFSRSGACVIEWAEKLEGLKPKSCYGIEIEIVSETERKLCVSSELAAQLKL